MTATPKSVTNGDPITFTLTVTNKGPSDANNVVVTDVFPAGATFNPLASGCLGSGSPVTVTCNLGTLAKAAFVALSFNMTPASGGSVANTATVSSDETDTVPSNNSVTIKTKAIFPDLLVKKLTLTFPPLLKNSVPVGGAFMVTDTTVNNQAASTVVGSTTAFYLSTDNQFDGGDVLLNSRPIGILAGKGSDGPTGTGLVIPALTTPGTYFILAVANDGGAVDEGGQDTNNVKASKKFTVTP
jgi:uncharacterized repeat protein (TIGR01451 family)